jgi:hypothetical protein
MAQYRSLSSPPAIVAAQTGSAVVTAHGKGTDLNVLAINVWQAPQLLVDVFAVTNLPLDLSSSSSSG